MKDTGQTDDCCACLRAGVVTLLCVLGADLLSQLLSSLHCFRYPHLAALHLQFEESSEKKSSVWPLCLPWSSLVFSQGSLGMKALRPGCQPILGLPSALSLCTFQQLLVASSFFQGPTQPVYPHPEPPHLGSICLQCMALRGPIMYPTLC